MSTKNNDTLGATSITEEVKSQYNKYNLNKFEFDLYDEEKNVPQTVVRVKRFSMPNKGEKWKIFENNKVMFIIEGSKLGNKEKNFLRTVDGINFLLDNYKSGIKSFNALKNAIKQHINEK